MAAMLSASTSTFLSRIVNNALPISTAISNPYLCTKVPLYQSLFLYRKLLGQERDQLRITSFEYIMSKIAPHEDCEVVKDYVTMRIVRSVDSVVPAVIIIKTVINICKRPQKLIPKVFSSNVVEEIFNVLRSDQWPEEIILLVTPASKHRDNYKLHLIDRTCHGHLGVCTIMKQEFSRLKMHRIFRNKNVIIASKYIKLKNIILETSIVAHLMAAVSAVKKRRAERSAGLSPNGLRYIDCDEQFPLNTQSYIREFPQDDQVPRPGVRCPRCSALPAPDNQQQENDLAKQLRDEYEYDYDTYVNNPNNPLLPQLFDKINNAKQHELTDAVICTFFRIAERYKFRIYCRPNVLRKLWFGTVGTGNPVITTFKLECFIYNDNYIGTIELNAEQLERGLRYQVSLMSRVEAVRDILTITPIPRTIKRFLRAVLVDFLGMDMIYDCVAEYLYEVYKRRG